MNNTIKNHSKKEIHMPVTVIGLGYMGQALAGAFLKGGHPTTIWNRSANKADDLVKNGAVRAEKLADAVSATSVVVVSVSTYEVMYELLDPIGDNLSGRVIINLTSGTPEDARKAAKWAAKNGAKYLEGAIMAVPQMIGSPEALIIFGGPQDLFKAHEPILKILGGNITYLSEDPGVPMLYDVAMLSMLYGATHSWLHANALMRTANISASEFQPYASAWFNNVITPILTDLDQARALDEADYATEGYNLKINQSSIGNILKASRELDIVFDWLTPIKAIYDQLVEEGYGDDNPLRIFERMKHQRNER